MIFRLVLLTVFVSLANLSHGQHFQPGNLVTQEGDTIVGLVAYATSDNMVFKENKKAHKKFYKRDQLDSFTFGESSFEKHKVEVLMGKFPEIRKVFLTVEVSGYLKLMVYEGKGLMGGTHTNRFLYHVNSEYPWRVPHTERAFKNQASRYFSEHKELSQRIKSKDLAYDQLAEIVEIYNEWIANNPVDNKSEKENN